MKPLDPPAARYAFGYHHPPRPGNVVNGLGESRPRRAVPVFHNSGGSRLDWQGLDNFFGAMNPWGTIWQIIRNRWQLRRARGPLAATRVAVDDSAVMTASIKARARALGAGVVGISGIADSDLYEGTRLPFAHAICLGFPMDREKMKQVPQKAAAVEVLRRYRIGARTAVRLAEHIRALGWPARAYANPNSVDILQIPLASRAGLGTLGKHGSLISREYGSNFRLAIVVTDLPLDHDKPLDIGVDDLCVSCRRCVIDCPPDAIFSDKQMVRGVRKWYVNFDKCAPYFAISMGCGICIEVCPWSEPGRGPGLSEKLLARRRSAS